MPQPSIWSCLREATPVASDRLPIAPRRAPRSFIAVAAPLAFALSAECSFALPHEITRYQITGGGGSAISSSYTLTATVGQAFVGQANSPSYSLVTGFWTATGTPLVPGSFRLRQVFPNPFASSTSIAFDLPQGARVRLRIYDVSGRLVTTLADGWLDAGSQFFSWDGTTLRGPHAPDGIYYLSLEAPPYSGTNGLILVR